MFNNLKIKVNEGKVQDTGQSQFVYRNAEVKNNHDSATNRLNYIENNLSQKIPNSSTTTKTTTTVTTKITTFVLAIISALTFGLVNTDAILSSKYNIQAEIMSLSVSETAVDYYIEIYDPKIMRRADQKPAEEYDYENFEELYEESLKQLEENDVYVIVYNEFTTRRQDIRDFYFEGTTEDLKPNVKYTIEVRQGSKVLAKKSFVTGEDYYYDYYEDNYNDDDYNSSDDVDDPTYNDDSSDGREGYTGRDNY